MFIVCIFTSFIGSFIAIVGFLFRRFGKVAGLFCMGSGTLRNNLAIPLTVLSMPLTVVAFVMGKRVDLISTRHNFDKIYIHKDIFIFSDLQFGTWLMTIVFFVLGNLILINIYN
ncbi:hypothetical protein RF11_14243 [Thelohanellus kitauei]|uniref:Uncharacterized protein n=1 Tax=Thelohanellus kitauei TaxID=669202 RepID=A0A0C2N6J1_THEKT|nr:hypothetical protein RF11_14243 [Thelohanellus kitauei]